MQIYESGVVYPFNVIVKAINQSSKFWTIQPQLFPNKTPYNLETQTNPVDKITRVMFTKISNDLPSGLELQKVYFCREFRNISYVVTGYRIFESHADAVANSNALAPTWSHLFNMIYISKTYSTIDCNKYGVESISDIYCCDDYSEVFPYAPEQATITINNRTVNLRLAEVSGFYGGTFSEEGFLYAQGRGGYSSHARYEETFNYLNFYGPTFDTVFHIRYGYGSTGSNHFLDIDVYEWIKPSYYRLVANVYYSATNVSGQNSFNLVKDGISYPNPYSNFYVISQNNFSGYPLEKLKVPDTIPCTISGTINYTPDVRLYIPDAQFYDSVRPINIGHIDEVLTFNPTVGMYISDLKNFYNIPGRFHILVAPNAMATTAVRSIRQDYNIGHPFNQESKTFGYFISNDLHGGHLTGIEQGIPFIDSRIFTNRNVFPKIYPERFSIAYSQWNDARFPRSVTLANFENNSFYTSNFYAITSKDPACFLSSLEV